MKAKIEIDTHDKNCVEILTVGWFSLRNLKQIIAVIRHEEYSQHDKRINFFGKHDDSLRNGAQIFVHLFDLPQDHKQLDEHYAFYKKQQKNFFLTDKKRFNPDTLILPNLAPDMYAHDAFQTRDGRHRRRIVHLYKNDRLALLIVYSLNSIEFRENTFFHAFAHHVYVMGLL